MAMETRTYDAIFFRQRPHSPLQVAFVAPSFEVDAWARVPTKKTGNVRNFQRAQIARHISDVEHFFGQELNASPTSVVVGFDRIRSKGRIETLLPDGTKLDVDSVKSDSPSFGRVRIAWTPDGDPVDTGEIRKAILGRRDELKRCIFEELLDIASVASPLLEQVLEHYKTKLRAGVDLEIQEDAGLVRSDEVRPESALDIAIPPESRELLAGQSPSEQQVIAGRLAFLAQTDPEVLAGKPLEHLQRLYLEVCDELKPGILIDGQHRIMGTKKMGNIPFLVTALPDADWPELAFQFIVTNRTAKRVPESLLISIIGNSLSKQQRSAIEERLREANIRVGLIEAVMRVHEDEGSPFYGMISFGLHKESGFLDAAAMRGKVIELWYERVSPVQQLFDHMCEGKKKSDRTDFWKSEELWFDYFVAFWGAVRERYASSNVFSSELIDASKKTPASKLMTATVLMIFQETVLDHLLSFYIGKEKAEKIPIKDSLPTAERFQEVVKNVLKDLFPEFFTEWKLSGFDGSKGARDDLADALRRVITGDRTVSQLKDSKKGHRLFRAESSKA